MEVPLRGGIRGRPKLSNVENHSWSLQIRFPTYTAQITPMSQCNRTQLFASKINHYPRHYPAPHQPLPSPLAPQVVPPPPSALHGPLPHHRRPLLPRHHALHLHLPHRGGDPLPSWHPHRSPSFHPLQVSLSSLRVVLPCLAEFRLDLPLRVQLGLRLYWRRLCYGMHFSCRFGLR
jgi:hypothetical protein